jgi:hypothetical protein
MGDVVELRPGDPVRSNYRCPESIFAAAETLGTSIAISVQHARAIDRDIRHLDAVIARVNDVAMISTMLSTICSADRAAAERVARAIGNWLRTGRQ